MALNKDGFEAGSILTQEQQAELARRKREEQRNVQSKRSATKRGRKATVATEGEHPTPSVEAKEE